MENKSTRRDFIKKSTLAVAGLSLSQRGFPLVDIDKKIIGANDKINTGFIGVGNRGTQLLHLFLKSASKLFCTFKNISVAISLNFIRVLSLFSFNALKTDEYLC